MTNNQTPYYLFQKCLETGKATKSLERSRATFYNRKLYMNHCLYYQQRSRNSKKFIQTKEQKSKKMIQTKEHKFNIKGLDGKGLCCHAAELLCWQSSNLRTNNCPTENFPWSLNRQCSQSDFLGGLIEPTASVSSVIAHRDVCIYLRKHVQGERFPSSV